LSKKRQRIDNFLGEINWKITSVSGRLVGRADWQHKGNAWKQGDHVFLCFLWKHRPALSTFNYNHNTGVVLCMLDYLCMVRFFLW
jgi:hypothetical protein